MLFENVFLCYNNYAMREFNEDTRVKIPATIQFLRLGYKYMSLDSLNLHSESRIDFNLLKTALEKINKRHFEFNEVISIIEDILLKLKNNDLGKSFYERLLFPQGSVSLIDFDNIENNSFCIVDELVFGPQNSGSFRPDITVLINGIPLAFLEVKKPNNKEGIQAEFKRMLNERLQVKEYVKYFNMLQLIAFSNNMEYENDDDNVAPEGIKAGSFYTTPNGKQTSFSFFREESQRTDFEDISPDYIKYVLKDNNYSPIVYDTPEFQTNLETNTPCNRFVTSLFDKERLLFLLHYGILYVDGKEKEKHIMRYPQFFASQAILKKLKNGAKRGIIFHTQGSGKTELSLYSIRILRDWYAKQGLIARFYYIVDRLSLLTQVSLEASTRNITTINVSTKVDFDKELAKPLPQSNPDKPDWGEIVVVNIQKFMDHLSEAQNPYNAKIQRIFFVDEAHRSYSVKGEFFKNLMLVDRDAVYIAMTGTPLLSRKERSNLKFGDYIHTYFYDKAIADHYTLRIKREEIDTTARTQIKENLQIEEASFNKKEIMEAPDYVNALGSFIEKDFNSFRMINADDSIGGMIVCCSNPQAKRMKEWFDKHSKFETGLVITDKDIPEVANKNTQNSFKYTYKPDILIVHQMLTTGYDVKRLKKMYLLRNAKEHTLLQTISRVNRPYRNPQGKNYTYGYITDFVDIAKEYDRTIENYLKEIEDEYSGEDGGFSMTGLVVGPEDINKKYLTYKEKLEDFFDSFDNVEKFSKRLSYFNKESILDIRRYLNNIKDCYTEFALSNAEEYIKQIDIDLIKKLIKETQNRIDILNFKAMPTSLMDVISNKEVCEIIYEFFKVYVEILNIPAITERFKNCQNEPSYIELLKNLEEVQKEIKRNKNHSQEQFVNLDEALKEIFQRLDITSWDDIGSINSDLAEVIKKMKELNDENERLSLRYGGDYAFVKTYSDLMETHPEYHTEDVDKLMDILYENTADLKNTGLLVIQSRDTFTQALKSSVSKDLFREGLYKKLSLSDNLTEILFEIYKNIRIF